MENIEKENKRLKVLLVILVVVLLGLGVYHYYVTYFNVDKNNDNEVSNNTDVDDNSNITDGLEVDEDASKNDNILQQNYIRETRVTLIEEPNCTGIGSSVIATIETNGNISIAKDRGAMEIEANNAKYLYKVGILACDNVKLYYITEDNDLYLIDNPNSYDLNQQSIKVSENKVTEFLGTESKSDGAYLKVLLKNGSVEYIKYFGYPN